MWESKNCFEVNLVYESGVGGTGISAELVALCHGLVKYVFFFVSATAN